MSLRVFLILFLLHLVQSKIIELSCEQIRRFVDGHNYRRFILAKGEVANQPAASEMQPMIWDEELAAKAANWASTNQMLHNPDETVESGRFPTGENIYMAGSTDLNWELDVDSALEAWFDEHKDFTYGPLKQSDFSSSSKPIGHYTQMAWSDSTHLGCGISETYENGMKVYYVVCNYGPTGNYLGQTPYKADGKASGSLVCLDPNCFNRYREGC